MKRKFIYGIAVGAFSGIAAWNVCFGFKTDKFMSSTMLANVEALAGSENPVGDLCDTFCYDKEEHICVLKTNYGFNINCDEMADLTYF